MICTRSVMEGNFKQRNVIALGGVPIRDGRQLFDLEGQRAPLVQHMHEGPEERKHRNVSAFKL
jgi:hypothetical protein